jgi:hypothetical protein
LRRLYSVILLTSSRGVYIARFNIDIFFFILISFSDSKLLSINMLYFYSIFYSILFSFFMYIIMFITLPFQLCITLLCFVNICYIVVFSHAQLGLEISIKTWNLKKKLENLTIGALWSVYFYNMTQLDFKIRRNVMSHIWRCQKNDFIYITITTQMSLVKEKLARRNVTKFDQ